MSSGSLKIFEIFGIGVELHWTFILMLAFIYLLLGPAYLLLIVLLFICVLVHELSHSFTALRNDVKVSAIILLPFGGASIIEDAHLNPLKEFNIAIVGPLTSLVLGGIFGLIVIFTPSGPFTLIFQLLFLINVLLGVFNLLPAFPMDGGRVLRSYLQRKHDLYKSTMITAKVTKYILALIIIGSLVYLFLGSGVSFAVKEVDLLLDLVIVVFLYGGMTAEEQNVKIRKEAHGLTLRSAISKRYVVVDAKTNMRKLYSIIQKKKEYTLLTKIDGKFSIINLMGKDVMAKSNSITKLAVPIPNIPVNTNVADALFKLETSDYGIAAITNGDKLLGITTARNLRTLISLHIISKKHT